MCVYKLVVSSGGDKLPILVEVDSGVVEVDGCCTKCMCEFNSLVKGV